MTHGTLWTCIVHKQFIKLICTRTTYTHVQTRCTHVQTRARTIMCMFNTVIQWLTMPIIILYCVHSRSTNIKVGWFYTTRYDRSVGIRWCGVDHYYTIHAVVVPLSSSYIGQ